MKQSQTGLLPRGRSLEEEGRITFGVRLGSRPQEAHQEGDADFQEGGVKVPWNLPGDGAMPPAIWPCQEEK